MIFLTSLLLRGIARAGFYTLGQADPLTMIYLHQHSHCLNPTAFKKIAWATWRQNLALAHENLGFKFSKDEADSGISSLKRRLGCGVHCLWAGIAKGFPRLSRRNSGESWPSLTRCCRKQDVLVWVLVGQVADSSAA